ncbi:ENTH-domain-containing protein [Suhomyces tanzawaensis NRRL Y-17324]|uniref:ENTH-domain-containing protein n=1 Tax=Suhomyces tanzawaensis NRRL Y-17324 TaxID=984487 RepID=A0A1E4SC91_9ASCO|nr:ENTH-domain-containing protein [Suhomyces tanzawaensis NRRL Y-17324]ODV77124.1 ENTH-domain-containing protein [Suhomyces tanzawaensis NRRL Y-17324]
MSKIVRSIKNVASGYSSVQVLVRNATSNDPSGPTTYDMEEISSYTYTSQTDFMEIMDMLDRRLNDKGKNWRHVAKSLTVLDYLVRFGSEKCVLWSKDNLYIIKTLREFIHIDEADNDQGAIIRVKAKELVSLLRDDERLRHERSLAADAKDGRRSRPNRSRRNTTTRPPRDQPYDEDLERALEISRITAEDEKRRKFEDENDPDLAAALKLSMEEEEMRKQSHLQNQNLLDLDDGPQQQYAINTGYYQPQQFYVQQSQPQQQYDMFGNPIQNPIATGLYQQQTFQPDYQYQQQLAQQQYAQQQQQQPFQQQQPQFTGFNFGQSQQQQQPQQSLQPLKTGNNNPFAMSSDRPQSQPQSQSLNELSDKNQFQQQPQQPQQPQQSQPQFYTQPTQLKPQNTSSSKFNDSTHSELNNLLAQGTGIDTFGNTGANRIPHQHTQTQNFINSSGTGYKQQLNEVRLSSNATGNPFLNVGIGYQGQPQQQQQQQQQQQSINPAYTGYGFGNQPNTQKRNDGPSLIDI